MPTEEPEPEVTEITEPVQELEVEVVDSQVVEEETEETPAADVEQVDDTVGLVEPAEELSVEVVEPEEPRIVGGPITIACDDGTNVVCSAGTADCFDGSEFYCGAPEPEIVSIPEPVVELEVEVTEPEPTPEVEEE